MEGFGFHEKNPFYRPSFNPRMSQRPSKGSGWPGRGQRNLSMRAFLSGWRGCLFFFLSGLKLKNYIGYTKQRCSATAHWLFSPYLSRLCSQSLRAFKVSEAASPPLPSMGRSNIWLVIQTAALNDRSGSLQCVYISPRHLPLSSFSISWPVKITIQPEEIYSHKAGALGSWTHQGWL